MHLLAQRDVPAELGHVVGAEEVGPAVRVRADAFDELRGERVDDPEDEVRTGEIVGEPGVAGRLPGLVGDLPVQDQVPAVLVRDHHRRPGLRQPLPVAYGQGEGLGHRLAALDGGGARGVRPRGVHPGEQLGLRGEQHPGLAERRQHLRDVAQERRVGAHDEHGALGQQLAVLVQQERRPVQRDSGLPGAGAALDDENTAVRGPDDAVLLGLDGPHDVAHASGARGIERREQHGVAVRVLETGAVVVPEIEDLVMELGDRAALGGDVASSAQAHRSVPRGEVEGTRHRRTPVDQHGRVVGVVLTDPDPADMVREPVGAVDAAETQRPVHRVERREQPRPLRDEDVPLQPRLLARADRRQRVLDTLGRHPAQCVDPGVEAIDEFLLFPQFVAFPV